MATTNQRANFAIGLCLCGAFVACQTLVGIDEYVGGSGGSGGITTGSGAAGPGSGGGATGGGDVGGSGGGFVGEPCEAPTLPVSCAGVTELRYRTRCLSSSSGTTDVRVKGLSSVMSLTTVLLETEDDVMLPSTLFGTAVASVPAKAPGGLVITKYNNNAREAEVLLVNAAGADTHVTANRLVSGTATGCGTYVVGSVAGMGPHSLLNDDDLPLAGGFMLRAAGASSVLVGLVDDATDTATSDIFLTNAHCDDTGAYAVGEVRGKVLAVPGQKADAADKSAYVGTATDKLNTAAGWSGHDWRDVSRKRVVAYDHLGALPVIAANGTGTLAQGFVDIDDGHDVVLNATLNGNAARITLSDMMVVDSTIWIAGSTDGTTLLLMDDNGYDDTENLGSAGGFILRLSYDQEALQSSDVRSLGDINPGSLARGPLTMWTSGICKGQLAIDACTFACDEPVVIGLNLTTVGLTRVGRLPIRGNERSVHALTAAADGRVLIGGETHPFEQPVWGWIVEANP